MLTDTDMARLDFEHQWWRYPGAKDAAIREQFNESPIRFYQVLNALIDQPAALAYDPLGVRRLRRLRDDRARLRAARRREYDDDTSA